MVVQRRFGPLIIVLIVVVGVFVARLWQVQILEHEIWAREARSLVRDARVVPFHRGRILDRTNRELVRDEDVYQIEFRYRDFRREHPIGVVAHARSALEQRVVSLTDARDHLEEWMQGLVELTPAALALFAEGQALSLPGLALPASVDALASGCSQRAADVRYYVACLLGLDGKQQRALRLAAAKSGPSRSYLELAAILCATDAASLLDRRKVDLTRAKEELAALAELLDRDLRIPTSASVASGTPEANLLAALEGVRTKQEDDAADRLFELATGFDPGRISTRSLARIFDLTFVARALRWDEARVTQWIETRRARFQAELASYHLPRILARVSLADGARAEVECLCDEIALLYAHEGRTGPSARSGAGLWRRAEDLVVVADLEDLFEHVRLPYDLEPRRDTVPLFDADLRAGFDELADPWLHVGLVRELSGPVNGSATPSAGETQARWRKLSQARPGFESPEALVALSEIVNALESRFLAETDRFFDALPRESHDGRPRLHALDEDRLERVLQQERFVIVDRSNRPLALRGEPSYELVHRIGRHPERFPGFNVRETTRRVALVHDRDGVPCGKTLLGGVRRPMMRELLVQGADEGRLAELESMLLRDDEAEREMRALAARLARPEEWLGDGGIEAYFDPELRGTYGYYESRGLAEREAGSPTLAQSAVDGLDLVLTLDADLQLAAQEALAHPVVPDSEDRRDRIWLENPVGAIVLVSADGEVLVAASEPSKSGHARTPGRTKERAIVRERSLLRPTFNPPGSVFKPFVAAYAIDYLDFDPLTRLACRLLPDGKPGFESMHCTKLHEESDLGRALAASCNSYFAQLGVAFEPEQMLEAAALFGFGQPTGIRNFGSAGRGGLREEWDFQDRESLPVLLEERSGHLRFANGLGLLEATPMQVARATVGLATGQLPSLRVVRSIGGRAVEKGSTALPISRTALQVVRDALHACVVSVEGTAHGKGLDEETLGFTFACKTGSADIAEFRESPELLPDDREALHAGRMRKHTWVAGWFPAENPRAALVVYLHDTSQTSSHTAVHLASQFLRSGAVRQFLEREPGR